jgi:hypothetical protein
MKVIFWIGTIFTLSVPLCLNVISGLENASWLAFLIGVFLILTSRFNDIAEITLGPLKAKLNEKIDEAIVKAEQLKSISQITAKLSLTQLMATNFMGGLTLREKIKLHEELIDELLKLKFTKDEILGVEESWRKGVGVLYHYTIHAKLLKQTKGNKINPDVTPEEQAVAKGFHKLHVFKNWDVPSPDLMESYIKDSEMMTHEISDLIDDYRYYLDNNELRNFERIIEFRDKE